MSKDIEALIERQHRRTWLCCHNCRWIESVTCQEPKKVNADGFCVLCGDPVCDPFDKDFPYDQESRSEESKQ